MKTKFLFSTLAMAAAFSACTQDEIAVNNENVGSFDEVVGAKLLGEGFSVYTQDETGSRVVVDGKGYRYSEGDKVAVAWVVGTSKVNEPQNGVDLTQVYNTVYANHMLVHGGDGKGFESRSNVYEGWHFAYAPFQFMAKPQQVSNVVVNPDFKGGDLDIDYLTNAPQFTNAAFVGEAQVNFETGKVDQNFPLQVVVNAIYPTLKPAAEFKHEILNKSEIKNVTLKVEGHDLFTNSFKVVPSKLGVIDYNEETKTDNTVIDATYFGADKAFQYNVLEAQTSVNIAKAGFTLGDETSQFRLFIAPTQNAETIELKDLSLKVEVRGGYFLINAETATDNNKTAFEKIFKMLKGTEESGKKLAELNRIRTGSNLNFDLLAKDFHTEFSITEYGDWDYCVKLANALGETNEMPVFTLTDKAEITFDAEHPMIVPDREFKVVAETTAKIIVDGEVAWPTNIWEGRLGNDNMELVVNEEAVLLVNSVIRVKTLTNNGTIKAESGAILGKGLTNEGEVVVAVGAKTTSPATKPGKISYRVPENYDLAAIQQVINEAHVNNLVIGQNVTLECAAPLNLEGINLEINGGSIESEGYAVTANNVTINGGDVCGVNIAGNLTVTEAATATVCDLYVAGDVENNGKLTLTDVVVNGTLTNEGEVEINADICTTIGNIVNNATLKANTDVYVETIVLGNSANTTIATGKTIWYSVNEPKFEQNGTTSGKIEYYVIGTKFFDDLTAAEDGAVVVMMKEQELTDLSVIPAGVTIKGAKKDYVLNIKPGSLQMLIDKNVTFENLTIEGSTSWSDGNDASGYEHDILFTGDVTFKNVVFNTSVAVAGNATFEGCTFNDPSTTYGLWIAAYGKTIKVTNCTFEGKRSITILDDFAGAYGVTGTEAEVTLNVTGTNFNTADTTKDYAIMAGDKSSITWGEGNVLREGIEHPVIVRHETWFPNANYKGVKVTGCELYFE